MDDLRIGDSGKRLEWDLTSNQDVEKVSGWAGSVTHDEAEERLQGKSMGTYVIRSGDETSALSVDQLMQGNHRVIQHYLLVVKGEEEKVEEHLILHTSQGWLMYSDEPNLNSYRPSHSLPELLSGLDPTQYQPLGT